jgi:hypothetical protein
MRDARRAGWNEETETSMGGGDLLYPAVHGESIDNGLRQFVLRRLAPPACVVPIREREAQGLSLLRISTGCVRHLNQSTATCLRSFRPV